MIAGLMVVAAASVAQLPEPIEHDMRCLAAIAVVVGASKDTEYQADMAKAGYFFIGKISVQDPNLDIGPHLRRILLGPSFGKEYQSESTKCLAEVEVARLKMAKAGEDLSKGR
ncbi:MAG: hypothetical protein WBL74_11200 [Novosphingobium sp.]|uniref:hypothetical protein n=1 Tax=Novosphingobium sp. TaxID=1874826 RepID=UPI003C7BCAD5